MAYVRFDDGWADNPKLVQAGPLAAHLWALSISYANRHLTDGHVPAGILDRLVGWSGISQDGEPVTNARLAEQLIAVGLWHRTETGYEIHDYLDHQPTRREVEKRRRDVSAARSRAGRKGGQANGKQTGKQTGSKPQATGKHPEQAIAKPHPIPSHPIPKEGTTPSPLVVARGVAGGESLHVVPDFDGDPAA